MPKLQPGDPKTLRSLLEKYGTLDPGIDPDEIGELLDQADEEIREADWDLKGQFPNGVLKSAEMAILEMALALALGYCRRLARRDEFDPAKGARAHRNAALLLWFWTKDGMPVAEPIAGQLVDVVTARNTYGYEGLAISMTEADDFKELVKTMRADLGERPIEVYRELMTRLAEARGELSEGGHGR